MVTGTMSENNAVVSQEQTENLALREALEELVKWARPSGYAPRRFDDAMAKARNALRRGK